MKMGRKSMKLMLERDGQTWLPILELEWIT